jgi:hypothetical protein
MKIIKVTRRAHLIKCDRQLNGQKEIGQKDKRRSTKHTYDTKDRVTRTPLKPGGELRCSGRARQNAVNKHRCQIKRTVLCNKLILCYCIISNPNSKITFFGS